MRSDKEKWEAGDTIGIGKYTIRPKRDFPPGSGHGWVVCEGACNVLPGATWGRTQEQAIMLMNAHIISRGEADIFWAVVSIVNYLKPSVQ